jgi:ankyrin repeat protein
LLAWSANPGSKDPSTQQTALHLACEAGADSSLLLEELLNDAEINIDGKDIHGCTALHVAAQNHNEQCVHVLLRRGADPMLTDEAGKRAVDYGCKDALTKGPDLLWCAAHRALKLLARDEFVGAFDVGPENTNQGQQRCLQFANKR